MFQEFIATYGMEILYIVVTAVFGFIGMAIKNVYQKYVDDKTKKSIVKVCVRAVEQLYVELHGKEKLDKCVESVVAMLGEKGITITELEIRMLIEAAVNEMNNSIDVLFDDELGE